MMFIARPVTVFACMAPFRKFTTKARLYVCLLYTSEERDFLAVQLYTVSTDVLGDTACLTFDDVGFADVVQQRSLTVIDVSHDCLLYTSDPYYSPKNSRIIPYVL